MGGDLQQNSAKIATISGGDLQTRSASIAKYIPKFMKTKYGELHLPGKNYCGPLTRLDIRLDENDVPNKGHEPVDQVDNACLKHDIAYKNNGPPGPADKVSSEDLRTRQKADVDLIHDLNEIGKIPGPDGAIQKPTFREKLDRAIVKTAMKAKIAFGGATPIVFGGEIVENLELAKELRQNAPKDGQVLDFQSNEVLAAELHKEYRNNKKYLKIKVFNKDDIWSADLIETVNSKNNDNFRYILTIIDLYTRFAWAIPLKNKTSNSIKEAFETLFENTPDNGLWPAGSRIPKKLYVDMGKEFYNKIFQDFLNDNEIEIYSTYNQLDERTQGLSHNPIIERFKSLMYKKFTENGNRIRIKDLPELIDFYNNKIHRTIRVTPTEAFENPELISKKVDENNNENDNIKENQKFNIGDRVRIYKWKNKFEKGVTHSWTKEIFIIKKIYNTKPFTYKLHDLEQFYFRARKRK